MTYPSTNTAGIVAGIDLGGTNTEIGIIDFKGECLDRTVLSTKQFPQPEAFTEAVFDRIADMAGRQVNALRGIGIGAPNGNYYTGCIEHAPNLDWKGVLPVADLMAVHTKVPVALTNDANAAAIGELKYGKAKGMAHFISITIGTGLGSGIVVGGKVLYGHTGFAGELGHTTVVPGGRLCTCGRLGCLEAYASARGLVETALELLAASGGDSLLAGTAPAELGPYQVQQAALQGDAVSIAAYEEMGRVLGQAIANATALLSPEAVFLFGGLSKAGDLLLKPARASFDAEILPIFKGSVSFDISALNQENAAILGAGALIWNKITAS